MTALATKAPDANSALYESLALKGDLSGLNPVDKAKYYSALCERLGLDPATQPFMPLKLNGKEILYATKGATDQLARLHNVNRQIVDEREMRDVYVVTVEATLPNGRKEQSKGAVTLGTLKGDAFCNAIMKAETKAKRRVTLSILGLGMLDESEVETIPAYSQQPVKQLESPMTEKEAVKVLYDPQPSRDDPFDDKKKEVADLCRALNATGQDSITWKSSTLNEYVNDLFEVEDGTESLTLASYDTLIADLESRLSNIENSHDAPVYPAKD